MVVLFDGLLVVQLVLPDIDLTVESDPEALAFHGLQELLDFLED